MKNTILLLLVAFVTFSCGTDKSEEDNKKKGSQDIDVEALESACDCSEAFIIVGNEVMDIVKEQQKTNDPELDHQITPRVKILEQINFKCQNELSVELDDVIACDSSVIALIEDLNVYLN